ncbi:papilin isoform X3 [Rhipicephalus microplus]|uniref:papilin isoform X3 n=1 Tax=Rhipicephalus microplus TaxID=6941 RepID=UPI003F6C18C0
MKTFVLLALCGAAFASGDYESHCVEAADPGPCKAHIPAWWFNVHSGKCEQFVYGGCEGNENKYRSKEECRKTCAELSTSLNVNTGRKLEESQPHVNPFACYVAPDQGPCRGSILRYYFDNDTQTCQRFTYGGCEGNANNYETAEQCKASCKPETEYEAKCLARPESGPCLAYMPMWGYDSKLGQCVEFIYGGCDGNDNKYTTEEECLKSCKKSTPASLNVNARRKLEESQPHVNPFACYVPPDRGPCYASIPRYYFDNDTQTCQRFIYGGCEGNANNYETAEQCKASCKPETEYEAKCLARAEKGPCLAYMPLWGYDAKLGQCVEFIYGGCDGNDNKYTTEEECLSSCKKSTPASLNVNAGRKLEESQPHVNPFACYMPPDHGPCRASIPRYYFDNETQTCQEFTYGGCQGNANNYETAEQCKASCKPETEYEAKCLARPERGPCLAYIPMWGYDANLGQCVEFIYGGCDGNDNKYPTKEKCLKGCKKSTPASFSVNARLKLEESQPHVNPFACYVPPDQGPCRASIPRYYFDNDTQTCKEFTYGGCEGNPNNYETDEQCKASCKLPPNPVCSLPKESGMCLAYFPRYYYNSVSKKCEQFIYGGCQGNANNFWTINECRKTCIPKKLNAGFLNLESEPKPTNPVCYEPKKVGPCKAYVPRYFYNTTTKFCERFVYGGCQGNGNNFPEVEECLKTCKVGYENVTERLLKLQAPPKNSTCYLPKEKGPCYGHFPRYYYNSTTGTCEQFIYGGCMGNANNFETLRKCERKCANVTLTDELIRSRLTRRMRPISLTDQSWPEDTRETMSLEDVIRANPVLSREVVGWNPVCNETKFPGPCGGFFPRYYYDNVTKTCQKFIYGGCRGNGNNFVTLEECQNTCWTSLEQHSATIIGAVEVPFWPLAPPEECTYSVDAGPCDAYMPRFFYNTLTKTCEQFVYGGCGGNANNFRTFDACQKKCLKVFGVVPRA